MNSQAATFPERVLRWFVPRLSPETRPWGEAMLAELDAVRGRMARLLWALGGSTVMMRMLAKQWMRPSPAWAGQVDPLAGGPPPPRRWRSIVLVALSLVLLLLPDVRQGLGVVVASFTVSRGRFAKPLLLDHVAAEARQRKDAKLLAAAALQSSDLELRGRWADEAIALDPSLTWIEYPIARSEVFFSVSKPPQRYLDDAKRRVAILQQWDPGNAIPYLLAAEITGGPPIEHPSQRPFDRAAWIREEMAGVEQPSPWRDAMALAFAAPRYDTYLNRRFLLMRDTLERIGSADPVRLILALSSHPVPNMMGLRRYSNYLVGSAAFVAVPVATPPARVEQPMQDSNPRPQPRQIVPSGTADPKRIAQYWQAALFGERMQLEGESDIDRMMGVSLQITAYRPLQQALEETGHSAEASAIAFRLREIDNAAHESWVRNSRSDPGRKALHDLYRCFAFLADVASLVAAACALILVIALLFAAERRWRRQPAGRVLRALLTRTPVVLCSACCAFFLCYLPYAQAFRGYMTAADVPDLRGFYDIFGAFFDTPFQINLRTPNGAYYGWWTLLGGLTLLLGWRLLHLVRDRRAI